MVGKWFYMAAVSCLVACWGIWGLFKNIWYFLRDSIRQMKLSYAKEAEEARNIPRIAGMEERIWLYGVFLAWFGTFLISALYKGGLL